MTVGRTMCCACKKKAERELNLKASKIINKMKEGLGAQRFNIKQDNRLVDGVLSMAPQFEGIARGHTGIVQKRAALENICNTSQSAVLMSAAPLATVFFGDLASFVSSVIPALAPENAPAPANAPFQFQPALQAPAPANAPFQFQQAPQASASANAPLQAQPAPQAAPQAQPSARASISAQPHPSAMDVG